MCSLRPSLLKSASARWFAWCLPCSLCSLTACKSSGLPWSARAPPRHCPGHTSRLQLQSIIYSFLCIKCHSLRPCSGVMPSLSSSVSRGFKCCCWWLSSDHRLQLPIPWWLESGFPGSSLLLSSESLLVFLILSQLPDLFSRQVIAVSLWVTRVLSGSSAQLSLSTPLSLPVSWLLHLHLFLILSHCSLNHHLFVNNLLQNLSIGFKAVWCVVTISVNPIIGSAAAASVTIINWIHFAERHIIVELELSILAVESRLFLDGWGSSQCEWSVLCILLQQLLHMVSVGRGQICSRLRWDYFVRITHFAIVHDIIVYNTRILH